MAQGEASGRSGRNSASLTQERATVTAMIRIYCRGHHEEAEDLCAECTDLLAYAMRKLDCCPFGSEKPKCADCSIHCYQTAMQIRICRVMRYAGPRLAKSAKDLHDSLEALIS